MARPQKVVDPETVRRLAQINCTMEEIGAVVGVSVDTLERRYADVIKEGRAEGRASLRRQQYKAAMNGNGTMLVWLGKQLLGQRDRSEVVSDTTVRVEDAGDVRERLLEELSRLASR